MQTPSGGCSRRSPARRASCTNPQLPVVIHEPPHSFVRGRLGASCGKVPPFHNPGRRQRLRKINKNED